MFNLNAKPFLLIASLLCFAIACKDSSIDDGIPVNQLIHLEKSIAKIANKFSTDKPVITNIRVDEDCLPEQATNCFTYLNLPIHQIYLPEFDCYVNASASIIFCYKVNSAGGLDLDIYIKNFWIYYDNENDCIEVKKFWALLKKESNSIALDEAITYFREYVANLYIAKFMNDFFKPELGQYFGCDAVNNSLYVNYLRNVCFRYCVIELVVLGDPVLEVNENTRYCGYACCKKTKKYCLEDGEFIIGNPVYEKIGLCSGQLSSSCADGNISIDVDCAHDCE